MFDKSHQVSQAVETGFDNRPVFVVGDLILDRYFWGEVNRISPEAPVPVVRYVRQSESPGGAGNVALNLANLGLSVTTGGFVGNDESGAVLVGLLRKAGIETRSVRMLEGRPTTTKTRIIGGHHQLFRLDVEDLTPMTDAALADLAAVLRLELQSPLAGVVLSDYQKGTLSAPLCQQVIGQARRRGIPVLVDPKGRDYTKYRGATALSPNRAELAEVTGAPVADLEALLCAGEALRQALEIDFITVTLSEHGIVLLEPGQARHFPAKTREVFDVSGAGDTVIATLVAGLVAGLDRADALRLANLAAGVVVGKFGTVPIERAALLSILSESQQSRESEKICKLESLLRRVDGWRALGERIIFTNGCFDILRAGHVNYLECARQEGKRLVVGVNSDRSVRAVKGVPRPIMPEGDRVRLLAALASVDAVILFDEDTPLDLIQALRPDVLVKGGDYREEQVVGARQVRGWGGKVICVPLMDGRSTSNIFEKISRVAASRNGQEF
jgi:D-beta-D-heptose 7-phosphate kinase / D-beta-D-heptose 1-phosphate adenosyltransferase